MGTVYFHGWPRVHVSLGWTRSGSRQQATCPLDLWGEVHLPCLLSPLNTLYPKSPFSVFFHSLKLNNFQEYLFRKKKTFWKLEGSHQNTVDRKKISQTGRRLIQDYYPRHGLPGTPKPHQTKRDDIIGDKGCLTNSPRMTTAKTRARGVVKKSLGSSPRLGSVRTHRMLFVSHLLALEDSIPQGFCNNYVLMGSG